MEQACYQHPAQPQGSQGTDKGDDVYKRRALGGLLRLHVIVLHVRSPVLPIWRQLNLTHHCCAGLQISGNEHDHNRRQ